MLETILFELARVFSTQPYLKCMYQAMFAIAYYGLFRIGELARGDHTVQARNVFIATNKQKILLILYTSKTHGVYAKSQRIKISAVANSNQSNNTYFRHFCPFKLMCQYFKMRGDFFTEDEPFFIYRDHSPVEQQTVRKILTGIILGLGFDCRMFTFHGMRSGRATDLHSWGFPIEKIQK